MSEKPPSTRIELRLRELAQLFNSMDPSPFVDRDLDAEAEEFILSWARELPRAATVELVIHLTTPPPPELAAGTQDAVRNYFAGRAELARRQFRLLMRRGRMSLMVGLLFLGACLVLGEIVAQIGHSSWTTVMRESLTIVGWVAMWRPLEIYLYEWWPLRDEWRLIQRLACMPVRFVLPKT